MSRAWIAFYMGDYLKDTQALTTEQHGAYMLLLMECWQKGSIPLDPTARAAIARLPLSRWKKMAPAIDSFFEEDGTNKRASKEIGKAEAVSIKRAMAGQRGGFRSGTSRAIMKHERSKHEANAKQTGKQNTKQNGSICEATYNSKNITTTSVVEGQGLGSEEQADKPQSIASAELVEKLKRWAH